MEQTKPNKSYATFGLNRSFRQVSHAFRSRKHAETSMAILLQMVQKHEARMASAFGDPIENLRILEIGPGQGMERACYFGLKNEVVGLDLDVIPQGFDPAGYVQMIRKNGWGRFAKTVGRKLIVGRANAAAWAQAVGSDQMQAPQVVHCDICDAVPGHEAFDVVMSWSVFEHLPQPDKALAHVIDSLRPGGIFYISLHLYSSNNGHHDIRAFTGDEALLPLWSHLRPSTQHLVQPSSYLNEWRLSQWRALFADMTPGHEEFVEFYDCRERFGSQLTPQIRQELAGYSDEELFAVDAIYLWRKPK
ncbi:MAG: class I SAM-dependent methyltransferase [Chloroflexi bacterium]|nr:class I SAM-dependent methyltransferase [Chloroflexota bacterium]